MAALLQPLGSPTEPSGEHVVELESKSIVVTGASSGIGAAAALLFAAEGANVVLGAADRRRLETCAGQINRGNGRAVYLSGDVKG